MCRLRYVLASLATTEFPVDGILGMMDHRPAAAELRAALDEPWREAFRQA
jgi:hypothetical protein